jgi:hypothetical protein
LLAASYRTDEGCCIGLVSDRREAAYVALEGIG